MAVWRIDLTLPEHSISEFEALFGAHAIALSTVLVEDGGEFAESSDRLWRLYAYCADIVEHDAVTALVAETAARLSLAAPEIASELVPDEDWAAKYEHEISLLFAGRFVVHGDYLCPPPGRIALCINAGNAFGSGMHGSTRGCLLALDHIAASCSVRKALDLGTGSGILAVAIAKCWDGGGMGRADVLAADIDPASVAVSEAVAEANGVAGSVRICQSDGFAAPEISEGAPYDLICANILANPLRQMAPEFARHLAPEGIVILSGLLASQEAEVVETYDDTGLRRVDHVCLGDWVTLLLTH